jgi:hypothetical protein
MASGIDRMCTGLLGGKKITGAPDGSIFISRLRSYMTSRAASEAVIYSVLYIDKAMIGCLLDL